MRCPSPITMRHTKLGTITAPCGKCYACKTNRRTEWVIRLLEEFKETEKATFVTLTYSDDNLIYGLNPTLVREHPQLFLKRLRKAILPRKIRYFGVGEYGTRTRRPHYHFILFNTTSNDYMLIENAWKMGGINLGNVTEASIMYCTKYHVSANEAPSGTLPEFTMQSLGIGKAYINKMKQYHHDDLDRMYYSYYGIKRRLPRYYKDKLYSKLSRKIHAKKAINLDLSKDEISFLKKNPEGNYWIYLRDKEINAQKQFNSKKNRNETI